MSLDKILLVDDEKPHLELLKEVLSIYPEEISIHTATSGEEALAFVQRKGPFAVILSDYKMGGMTGLELLTCAGEIHPSTSRVMISGAMTRGELEKLKEEGIIHDFLVKPIDIDELIRKTKAGIMAFQGRSGQERS
ncbi:MAG: hypothetical protein COV67_11860 [Nitrospinae bacterium CG11_big_fil_rev_8_21_14_0_20_56_8]|nr:MAG: hypothetical protein COV67_11860 [Nitrospinae bacterium CG11_big_fil_rev_8_21_14_0_20_56_8]